MDDSKQSSAWDQLASELGAQPPADADQRRRPAVQFEFQRPAESSVQPPPGPKPSDWNALANNLGIEVPPEPQPPLAKAPPAAKPVEPAAETPSEPSRQQQSWLDDEPGEGDVLHHDEVHPDDSEIAELSALEDEDSEFELHAESSDLDDDDDEGLSGEAARTAFDALFEAGSFAALGSGFDSDEAEEARLGAFDDLGEDNEEDDDDEAAYDDSELESDGVTPADDDTKLDAADDELDADDAVESASEDAEDEAPRKRRRRRRRGGRGRGRGDREKSDAQEEDGSDESELEEESTAAEAESESDGDEGDEGGEPKRRRRRRGRRRKRSEGPEGDAAGSDTGDSGEDESDSADADDDDGDDDDDRPRGRPASHKNIPTWSDAVGVMVDANLSSRKANPGRGDSGGRGRGRSRGGRRRNKGSS